MSSQAVGVLRTSDDREIPVAATEINREDFGLAWNVALETGGVLVGKTAHIELAVQAIAAKAAV